MTTTNKQIVLWVKPHDPPSERAKVIARGLIPLLPTDVDFSIKDATCELPPVVRVPSLVFYLQGHIVCVLEGVHGLDDIVRTLRNLG
jgi:hypothetical protein